MFNTIDKMLVIKIGFHNYRDTDTHETLINRLKLKVHLKLTREAFSSLFMFMFIV